ncbi:MAG TPA: flavin reductase family protein [Acidimicrobiales bacterium]|nr:flavin reductase family protein [Acidimicrobiales bacterium]
MAALDSELINTVTWRIPNALVIIGSRAGDQRNAMTASWVSQVAMEPVLIGVSVEAEAVTARLIRDGGSFSVNLWDASDSRSMVKFAKPADVVDGAIKGRAVRDAPSGVPVFDEAVAWLDCAVRHTVELGSHVLFVGELTALAQRDGDAEVASMAHTRMKYGGVARR